MNIRIRLQPILFALFIGLFIGTAQAEKTTPFDDGATKVDQTQTMSGSWMKNEVLVLKIERFTAEALKF